MINVNLIPKEKDQLKIKEYHKAMLALRVNVYKHEDNLEQNKEIVEQLKNKLHELNAELALNSDANPKVIADMKKIKAEITDKIQEMELLDSIDIKNYIEKSLNSEKMLKLKREAVEQQGKIRDPLIVERNRLERQYKDDQAEISKYIDSGDLIGARLIEVELKHYSKGKARNKTME